MGIAKNSRWGGVARKLICGMATVALSVGLVPTAAFAAANVNNDGYVVYDLPKQPVKVQHTATDKDGHEYTYQNLTVCLASPPMQRPYYSLLGISNSSLGRTIVNGGFTETEYGLFGSDANENPDEYLYNYCVTLANKDAIVPADSRSVQDATVGTTINGAKYNMPREIYTEANMLTVSSTANSGDMTYAKWVELENQRTDRSKTGTYNPVYTKFSTNPGGTYKMVESIYSIAEEADKQIKASADENGNYTLRTRYAEGPNTVAIAGDFEDISKGVEYYVLSKVADGSIPKLATAAVICGYDPGTKHYAVRVLNPEGVKDDKDSNFYAGRIASAVAPMVTDITTLDLPTAQDAVKNDSVDETAYVKWYTAQQIIENCAACFTCDAPASNVVSKYLATASDGKKYSVYAEDTGDGNVGANNLQELLKAQADAKSAGKPAADICNKWPKSLFGVWYAQGCENVMMNFFTAAYLYPEFFNLTDMMAWWAKHLWHIKDASIQDIVDSTTYNISLSTNQSKMGTVSANYNDNINAMIKAGNQYYLNHIKDVDAVHDGNIKTHNVYLLAKRVGMSAEDATAQAKKADAKPAELAAAAAAAGENVFALANTIGVTTDEAYAAEQESGRTASEIATDAEQAGVSSKDVAGMAISKASKDVETAKQAESAAKAAQQAAEKAAEEAKKDAEAAKKEAEDKATAGIAEAREAQKKAEEAQKKAEAAQKVAEQAAAAAASKSPVLTVVEVNKATVKAADIPASATTVILGSKVKKISANSFKGKKATTVIVMGKKLKKAGVKNAFKKSKVKTVQVPSAKTKAYKKIFTKKNCGQKVKVI